MRGRPLGSKVKSSQGLFRNPQRKPDNRQLDKSRDRPCQFTRRGRTRFALAVGGLAHHLGKAIFLSQHCPATANEEPMRLSRPLTPIAKDLCPIASISGQPKQSRQPRPLLWIGLVLALLMPLSLANAQQGSNLPPVLQAMLRPDNPVVGRVGAKEIRWNDVIYSARRLPPEQQSQVTPLFQILLARLVDRQLLADAARVKGYANRPEIRAAVRRFEEDLMRDAYVGEYLTNNVNAAAVEARVKVLSNGNRAQDATNREQVRAEMSRLALDRLLTQLRQQTPITLFPPR